MKKYSVLPGIQIRRVAKGMTQEELARRSGLTRGALAMYESGASSPNAKLLPQLAEALGCTIDDLFSPEDPEDNHNYIPDLAAEP